MIDWEAEASQLVEQLTGRRILELSSSLGVPEAALQALGVGWTTDADLRRYRASGGDSWKAAPPDGAYAFPERDGRGRVIGMALRAHDGRKGAPSGKTGSRRGLTVPATWNQRSGPVLIVEGASDVAACEALQLRAVGRPSNAGGGDHLAELLDGMSVIVVGENDAKPGGAWPGRDGAKSVAARLASGWRRPVQWGLPPEGVKDIRAYLAQRVAAGLDLSDPEVCRAAGEHLLMIVSQQADTCSLTSQDEQPSPAKKPAAPIRAWEPFPVDLLPEVAARFVNETADSMGSDPALVALHVIAILGVCIGTTRRIELKPSWREYPIFWTVTIARSSGLKSPAMDAAINALRDVQKVAYDNYNSELAAYETERMIFEKALKFWNRSKDQGDPPAKPVPPSPRRFVIQDITIEALAPILESNRRGVLVARDEMASHLRSFGQYKKSGGGDAAAWLEFHRGGAHTVDRKTGERRLIYIDRAAVWKCGTIQPGVFSSIMSGAFIESGMAARFLVARPPCGRKRWTDRSPHKSTLDAYADLIARLIQLQHIDNDGTPLDLPLTHEAKSIWIDWYDRHADLTYATDDDGEAAMLGKVEAYACRLALLFTICDDPYATYISEVAMRRACQLAGWFANEAMRVYGTMSDTIEDQRRRKLVEWIQERGCPREGVTVRDLMKGLRRFKGDKDQSEVALNDLVDAGLGTWQHTRTGGRPTKRFVLAVPIPTIAAPVPKTPDTDADSRGNGDGGADGSSNCNSDREDFEERAAHLEFDGGLTRDDAEAEARRVTGYTGAA
ncbi:MAG TPA: YfjI family protein [Phycisphaerae bacterium]|nr:YfjI family protein [Phycisphaerae bacterium]HRW53714.1 YfjI family protein [Phycisphaerae bacterium]